MNASASLLDREVEVQTKIGKVRTFGRIARAVCAAIFAFGVVGIAITLIAGVLGVFGVIGPGAHSGMSVAGLERVTTAEFTAAQLSTPALQVWGLLVLGVVTGVGLAVVHQLYRLFGSLAAGDIYTRENVRRLRHVGVLWVLLGLLGIVIPFMAAMFVELGFFLPSIPSNIELEISPPDLLGSFIGAGLILLVSWILDVGLYEKDHAEALQRDADLVI